MFLPINYGTKISKKNLRKFDFSTEIHQNFSVPSWPEFATGGDNITLRGGKTRLYKPNLYARGKPSTMVSARRACRDGSLQ